MSPSLPPSQTGGAGDLLVAPIRIILEGRHRSDQITLVNTGSQPATYRISFLHMAMDETGDLKEVEKKAGEIWADDLVRYSPREVLLEPKATQTVRLQVRKPAGLPPGEYRAHLLFRAIPPTAPAVPDEPGKAKGFSVTLTPIYGVSIPIVIREGETKAEATLSTLAIVPAQGSAPAALTFQIQRAGNQSVYGNLAATFIPASGKPEVIGQMNGVAVYTSLNLRKVRMPLTLREGLALTGGKLHLTYRVPEHETLLAEAWLDLP